MKPEFRKELRELLPAKKIFPYFAEREGGWLLHHRLRQPARIAELRRGPLAPLLTRPGVRDVVAACGRGWVTPENLLPLAEPLDALSRESQLSGDRATEVALDTAVAADWREVSITHSEWADGCNGFYRRELQVSRTGGNLVIQVNFPEAFQDEFDALFPIETRRALETRQHPVRKDLITMGWIRLDFERDGEDLLIEEVQTDWLRIAKRCRNDLAKQGPSAFEADRLAFLDRALALYGRDWARMLMLVALDFARTRAGIRHVWMHQYLPGAKLKHIIEYDLPPRSLYTDLPRRFGFVRTDRAPAFLYPARSQVLSRLRRQGEPLFWRLDLNETV
ncbi:MAG: hypothetical protein AAFV19_13695 [Pseudomonadota bacterium]